MKSRPVPFSMAAISYPTLSTSIQQHNTIDHIIYIYQHIIHIIMAPLSTMRHRDSHRDRSAAAASDENSSMLIPLTNNHYCSKLDKLDQVELGYEDTHGEDLELGNDAHEDDQEEEEAHLAIELWQRLPLGLTIALVLFCLALLTTLRIIYVYEHLYHSGLYAAAFAVTVVGAFGMSAYIVLQTFWYTQMDLERTLDQQDRARALLSSVYPEHVLQRLLEVDEEDEEALQILPADVDGDEWLDKLKQERGSSSLAPAPTQPQHVPSVSSMKTFANRISMPLTQSFLPDDFCEHNHHHNHHQKSPCQHKSVTDLYPDCTVFYATIQGFNGWSSTRSPDQVFLLLETIFCDFDALANQANVFKVEAMADCYIAATGLPEADFHHATRMAQFASDCLASFLQTTERLERTLGPDTADLMLRTALNSGPVTAGVLRGERSRFQLFGDTVNNGTYCHACVYVFMMLAMLNVYCS